MAQGKTVYAKKTRPLKAQPRRPHPRSNDNLFDGVKTHAEVLEGNLGSELRALAKVEKAAADMELDHQTRLVAAKLESLGVSTKRADTSSLVLIGMQTGATFENERWRNINLLPTKAKENRRLVLNEFSYWLKRDFRARNWARYLVITSGETCTLDELPDRFSWFSKRLGAWVKYARRDWGMEIVLYTFEIAFSRGDDGVMRAHLHANVVYIPGKAMKTHDPETGEILVDDWGPWLDWCRKWFGVEQIEDAGKVKKPEEIIKYVSKPADVMQLTSDELLQVHETIIKKKLVRPVGGFSDFRRDLKKDKLKIVMDRSTGQYVKVKMRSKEESVRDDVVQDVAEKDKAKKLQKERERGKDKGTPETPENQILFRTLPQARGSLLMQTFVGVRGYTTEPETARGKENLEILQRIHAEELGLLAEKGVTPPSRLDTCTITLSSQMEIKNLPEERRKKLLKRLKVDPEMSVYQIENSAEVYDAIFRVISREFSVPLHDFSAVDGLEVAVARNMTPEELEAEIPF